MAAGILTIVIVVGICIYGPKICKKAQHNSHSGRYVYPPDEQKTNN